MNARLDPLSTADSEGARSSATRQASGETEPQRASASLLCRLGRSRWVAPANAARKALRRGLDEALGTYGESSRRRFTLGAQSERDEHVLSGELAYSVAIERNQALLARQDQTTAMAVRVTHVLRKDNGAWKRVHRHADPLMGKTAPAAVLQQ